MPRRKRTGGMRPDMGSNFGAKINEEFANEPLPENKTKSGKRKNKK